MSHVIFLGTVVPRPSPASPKLFHWFKISCHPKWRNIFLYFLALFSLCNSLPEQKPNAVWLLIYPVSQDSTSPFIIGFSLHLLQDRRADRYAHGITEELILDFGHFSVACKNWPKQNQSTRSDISNITLCAVTSTFNISSVCL